LAAVKTDPRQYTFGGVERPTASPDAVDRPPI